jgi:hypothetical protein
MAAEADDPQQCSHGRHRLGQRQIERQPQRRIVELVHHRRPMRSPRGMHSSMNDHPGREITLMYGDAVARFQGKKVKPAKAGLLPPSGFTARHHPAGIAKTIPNEGLKTRMGRWRLFGRRLYSRCLGENETRRLEICGRQSLSEPPHFC